MPSSTLRHLGNQPGQPVMQPTFPPSYRPDDVMIHTLSWCALGTELNSTGASNFASGAYPATNRALGFMFSLADYFLVQKVFWVNGTTATTDNADVAVYTEDGATRLVAAGSTLIATANVVQEVDVTDTLLAPGRYWCVYNQNGTTATPMRAIPGISILRACGAAQFAGAVPLGSAFTPAAIAATAIPLFGIAQRTQVA